MGSDAAALVPNPAAEELIGARAFRVIFALVSLPLAVVAVVYFINHRYSGTPLWNLRGLPLVHESVWGLSFISFFFLYPSTFNLLEVGPPAHHVNATHFLPVSLRFCNAVHWILRAWRQILSGFPSALTS